MSVLENVIDDLVEEYEKAKRYEFTDNPIAYALHQVWKKYKNRENKYLRSEFDGDGATDILMREPNREDEKMSSKPNGEMICPVCGKMFYCFRTTTWTYRKYHNKELLVLCSWGCLQKHNRMVEEERKNRKE